MRLLFVCLGNFCRSPMAEGLMEAEIARRGLTGVIVDSAGTGGWHATSPPDGRAVATMARRGIDITHQRSRLITTRDLETSDLILAMDSYNLLSLRELRTRNTRADIRLIMSFAPDCPVTEVPDPDYGNDDDFERVCKLLELATAGLADSIAASKR